MVRVTLDNISKFFGKVKAVVDLNLEIKDGEFVAFLGPSGCGKTTTLLMVAGIYRPSKGRILFDDEDVTGLPPKDRNIGMVFQSYALYPHMSVYDNIAFPLKLKKVPQREIDRKVKEIARLLRIDELLDRKPAQLSGGQKQRVALGRALVKEPDVLLLDEPLSNLDAQLRILMRAEIKRLQKELRITTIYVTHDQVEAMTMADRIAVMNKGRLQQYADPQTLYNKPANIFVASFIGSPPMNLIEGELESADDNSVFFVSSGVKLKLPNVPPNVARDGPREVVLGVRPEDLQIVGPGDAIEEETLEGSIYVVEPLGKEFLINVQVGDHVLKMLVPADEMPEVGQNIRIRPNFSKIHLFDKKSQEAII